MTGEIPLTVSIEVQLADATASPHWILPDAGTDRPISPHDVAWQTNIDR
jgi:hypothetical protein